MAATNHTTNYNLPQYIGTDKPTYLGDWNSTMGAIDTQMKTNADNASGALSAAQTAQTNANSALSTAQGADSKADTAITNAAAAQSTADNATSVATSALSTANTANSKSDTNTNSISALDTKVGDLSDLDTTDKTSVVNAINEVATSWTSLGSASGSNPITLPNDYKELMLEIDSPTAGNFAFCLERTMLSSTSKNFNNGGYISINNCSLVSLGVTLTSANINYVYVNGENNVTSAATLYVWYK